ncbi:response regulator [Fulvivirga sp. M361]|uniref:hybrid sensor histidine kinase/response regulator transcription factor n=1 Tax=Fulvivirga sp. M361 TaxID=2594266 RepID=UPI00117B3983|nr:hybrid sensor histidine kinase/response regulator transcription factor [Fulvivirga sp. M361]TRX60639.1 response regulator [Fulvivirga sp. M361]
MFSLKTIVFLFFGLVQLRYAPAQQNEIQFSRYTTLEGLSENYVNCIFQDSRGFIWIGTNDGLNRFDGYNFKTYRYKPNDPDGISTNLINTLTEDQEGNLWIGTTNEGLCRLDTKREVFTYYRNTRESPDLLTKNAARILITDKNNNIWMGNSLGLHFLKKSQSQSDTSTVLYIKKMLYSRGVVDIRTIAEDGQNIWVGARSGLFTLPVLSNNIPEKIVSIKQEEGATSNFVLDIVPVKNGLIIAYGHGIYKFRFNSPSRTSGTFKRISDIYSNDLLLSSDNSLWCATNDGLYSLRLDTGNDKVINTIKYSSNEHSNSLSNNVITSLFQDRSGLIWIGTNGGGVNVLNTNKKKFRHYTSSKHPGSLSTNIIRSLYEDSHHNLYIGTNEGIYNFLPHSAKNNYQTGFRHYSIKAQTTDQREVYCFSETTNNTNEKTIWIGSGFPQTIVSIPFDQLIQGEETLTHHNFVDHSVFSLLMDKDNNLWVGTYLDGLYKISNPGRKQTIEHFRSDMEHSIASDIVRSIYEDKTGNIWIGTDNGLSKLPTQEKRKSKPKIITYTYQPEDLKSLSHSYILSLYESKRGEMWVGTMGGGLNKVIKGVNADSDTFISYDTEDGLPNNVIKGILEDDMGNLWISSNKGISKFNPSTLDIKNYDIFDGLQDFEFMEAAACKRYDGEMLFGGINGINAFYPDQIIDDTSKVKIVLTDFQLSHRSVPVGKKINGRVVLDQLITATRHIVLNHDQNSFAITFAALHYVAPKKNQYAYKLEGFDKAWVKVNALNRVAEYTNLSSGDYVFKVKATNNDGIWTDQPRVLYISITKPIFLTSWAIFLYSILLLAFFWFLRKYSVIRNNKKNELLMARFEKEKLDELTKLKFNFFTNISHEFKTPLSLIIGYHEKLQRSWDTISKEKIKADIDIIQRNSNVLLRLIHQLMDFRKLEEGKMKVSVEKNDIVSFVSKIHESFDVMAKQKNIKATLITSSQTLSIYFDKEKTEKIIYNLLSNAFKYTPKNESVETRIIEEEDQVVIKITDTGIGIPKEMQSHLFERFYQGAHLRHNLAGSMAGTGIGLALAKELVEIQGGEIYFTSKEGSGTSLSVVFPKGMYHLHEDQIADTPGAWINGYKSYNTERMEAISTHRTAPLKAKTSINVLMVDDEADIIHLVKESLPANFVVKEAENGSEAFSICLSHPPDLVVSDIMMPVMDGYELCHTIKNDPRTSHIPIILLTAKDSSEGRIRGYTEGADGYINKPFSLEELTVHILSVIDSRNKIRRKFKEKKTINPDELDITNLDKKFIKQVSDYVESNLSNPDLSVEQLVNHFKISDVTLNKKLRSLTGKTASNFIRSMRLKRALYLLQNETLTVSEITYKVGFNDLKYFRECFKKEFSINPSDTRRQNTQ